MAARRSECRFADNRELSLILSNALTPFTIPTPVNPANTFAGVPPSAVTYLRFASEAEANKVFGLDEPLQGCVDIPGTGTVIFIGTIYNDDAIVEDGEIVTPATPKSGWHVNVLA